MKTIRCAAFRSRRLLAAGAAIAGAALAQTNPVTPEMRPTGATMQTVRIHAFGDRAVLRFEDAPRPEPKAGEMLVRVRAAGVNPVDWKIRSGMIPFPREALPLILGYDVSGEVARVGEGVEGFKAGDEVFAYLPLQRGGGYAQFVIVKPAEAAMKPTRVNHEQAGATPLAALTAWQALFDTAGLREGQRVLIHAGSGGVGHFAIQLAKWKGATVYATASGVNQEFLRELGADVSIDYKSQKFEEVAKDMDVVLDSIGGETQERSMACLKPGGFLVSIVQPPSPEKLGARGAKGAVILVKPSGKQLAEIGALMDAGTVRAHVSLTCPLADVARAHEMSESGRTKGKIVLIVP